MQGKRDTVFGLVFLMVAALFLGVYIGRATSELETNIHYDQILVGDDKNPKVFDVYRNKDGDRFEFEEVKNN